MENISDTKYCKYCESDKPIVRFRIRFDKRREPPLEYLNNKCKDCDAEYTRQRHYSLKDDPEYKKKNSKRSSEYAKRTGKSKARWQKENDDPKRINALKEWRENNRWRVSELHKIAVGKYHTYNMSNMTDVYIARKIKDQFPWMERVDILRDKELMDLKRAEILIYRLNKHSNGKK
jgi:hypothetical protein